MDVGIYGDPMFIENDHPVYGGLHRIHDLGPRCTTLPWHDRSPRHSRPKNSVPGTSSVRPNGRDVWLGRSALRCERMSRPMSDAQASAVRQAASPEPSVEEWADRCYVGAEMRGGSDGPSQVVPVAMEFVGPLPPPGARVLLAGPHDDGLAERLAAHGYRVDVQLRAIDDARSTMSRLPASVTVLCGSLTRVHETYDVVVALGGVNHLASADAPVDDLSAALDAFTDRLAPGGLAAIIVRNDLGIDHLTSSGPPGNRADPFSAGRSALAASLSAAGLVVVNEVCLYPDAVAPSVFVRADAFAAAEAIGDDDDAVATVVASAYRSTVLAADTLVDPRRLARSPCRTALERR